MSLIDHIASRCYNTLGYMDRKKQLKEEIKKLDKFIAYLDSIQLEENNNGKQRKPNHSS